VSVPATASQWPPCPTRACARDRHPGGAAGAGQGGQSINTTPWAPEPASRSRRSALTRFFRLWLGRRLDAYFLLVTALSLNLPLLSAALARHLEAVPLWSIAGAYAGLVFVGYYGLILLFALTLVFALTAFAPRFAVISGGALLLAAAGYLLLNSVVHRVFRFHVDGFWIHYVLTSFEGIGIPAPTLAVCVAAAAWRSARRS